VPFWINVSKINLSIVGLISLELDSKEVEKIKEEYNMLIKNYGAEIKSVTRIVRTELESPSILQNADFSLRTIKELIAQGEKKHLRNWHIVRV
jgi:hypothetical protein